MISASVAKTTSVEAMARYKTAHGPTKAKAATVVTVAVAAWHRDEFEPEVASREHVDPTPELRSAAVESARRLKSLRPEVVYLSHCEAYRPAE